MANIEWLEKTDNKDDVLADDFNNVFKKIEQALTALEDGKADTINLADLQDSFEEYKTSTDDFLDVLDKSKVDKADGKDLSSNDFTDVDKEGLDFAVEISRRIHLDNTEQGKWLSKNDYTDEDKEKVKNILSIDDIVVAVLEELPYGDEVSY